MNAEHLKRFGPHELGHPCGLARVRAAVGRPLPKRKQPGRDALLFIHEPGTPVFDQRLDRGDNPDRALFR